MERTRIRGREQKTTGWVRPDLGLDYGLSDLLLDYEKMSDSGNPRVGPKRKRSNSPVYHFRYKTVNELHFIDSTTNSPYSWPPAGLPRGFLAAVFESGPWIDKCEQQVYNLVYKVRKNTHPLLGEMSFSLTNFFYELRELPSLLDPAKIIWKRSKDVPKSSLNPFGPRRRSKKTKDKFFKKPSDKELSDAFDDVTGTYVNAQFGYVPTISDGFEIADRMKRLPEAYQDLVDKLGKPIFFTKKANLSGHQYYTFTNNDSFGSFRLLVRWEATATVRGSATYWCNELSMMGPLMSTLARGGLNFNLGTVWNAIPFSWAVDWIIPIGSRLQEIGPKPLDIFSETTGTTSYVINFDWYVLESSVLSRTGSRPTPMSAPNWTAAPSGKAKLYVRDIMPRNLENYSSPPLGPINIDAKKASIAAAIGAGFRPKKP